jgi:hypothetical protein
MGQNAESAHDVGKVSFTFFFLLLFPIFQFQSDLNSNKILICTHTKISHECKVHVLSLFIYLLLYLFI